MTLLMVVQGCCAAGRALECTASRTCRGLAPAPVIDCGIASLTTRARPPMPVVQRSDPRRLRRRRHSEQVCHGAHRWRNIFAAADQLQASARVRLFQPATHADANVLDASWRYPPLATRSMVGCLRQPANDAQVKTVRPGHRPAKLLQRRRNVSPRSSRAG